MKFNFGWKEYWKPTPKKLRLLGDGLLWTVSAISGITIFVNYDRYISIGLLLLGLILKLLSNCFSKDDKK